MIEKLKERVYLLAKRYSTKVGLDLPYFIKGGFWLGVSRIFLIIKGFLLSVMLANMLSKESFGEYNFVMTILILAGIFALPGMGVAVVQAVTKGYEGTYFKALREVFKYSWIGSLFLLVVSVYEYYIGNFDLSIIFVIISSLFPFYSISGYYSYFFNGKKRFDILAKITSLFAVLSTLFVIIFLLITRSVFWIVLITVLSQILICGYFSIFYVKNFIERNKVDLSSIKFGKNISKSMVLSGISANFDSLIIAHFLNFSDLAIFRVIMTLPSQFELLVNTFSPLILPKMASSNLSKRDVLIHFKKFLLMIIGLICVYIVVAPIVYYIFYPKYFEYTWLSLLYSLTFINFLYLLPYNYLIKEKKRELINKFNTFSALLLIMLSFIGVFYYGLFGAVMARVIYSIVVILFITLLFLRA
ncbi:polysaccharide biosynthesis protein [Methanofervidicoccus sp. A16]|uniref:oligosaccharide flippase family protein n=1 Tax=Methanofervidicoccus sp. A16 TaxID=2607662 RepID=UPI00118CF398|nr:oligosaccharide flippase family protein [Methanofervidicoccus sp. A16]AXI24948.1 polysaccharide biosynthesis protein [Methanofervidicoccus sp. A16]